MQEDLKNIMPISEVKAGMKGYGVTVFKGVKLEKFDVYILGVLHKVNNGKDLVLARLVGGPVTKRGANIIQGMSGSPVYVNGRMVGAVAYGPGSFSREPICMLTPVGDMLDSLDTKLPSHPSGLSSFSATLDSPVKMGTQDIRNIEIRKHDSGIKPQSGTFVMEPLMTPLMISGMSQKNISRLADLFESYGIEPMAGPGSSRTDVVPVDLVPGAGVAVMMTTGDIEMTGVGTVTYRRGNKIVAFGHPMYGIGPIDAPMATAWVHDVFPSYQVSFKIASPMKIVGRIFEDRPFSIGGEIGPMPKLIPVVVDVDDQIIGRHKTFNVNILNHPLLTPKLLMSVANEAITQTHGIPGEAMAKVSLEVDADQVGKIVRNNVYFDPVSIEEASLGDLGDILSILVGNKFHPLDVKSVHLSVKIESGRRTANIERIFVDKSRYEPGETINVGVELRPYKSEKIVKTIQVKIPKDVPDGRIMLQVSGGGAQDGGPAPVILSMDGGPSPKATSVPPSAMAESIKQIVDKYLEGPKNDEIVAKLILPRGSLNVSGQKFARLPGPLASVMASTKSSSVKMEPEEVKFVESMGYVLLGGQMLQINVSQHHAAERASGPDGPGEGPGPQPVAVESDNGMEESVPINQDKVQYSLPIGKGPSDAPAQPAAPSQPAKPEPAAKPAAPAQPAPAAPPAQPTPPAEQKGPEKWVGRQPSAWRLKNAQDFAPGEFSGVATTSEDDLRLIPTIKKLSALSEAYVWTVIPDGNGGVFAGTGNSGLIYRVKKDGSNSVFYRTKELEVQSMARDSKGVIYAGTSPNGKVFRVSPDGKGDVVFDAPEKYIVAVAVDSKDNVYAATGDAGIIYRVTPDGKSSKFAELPEASVLSLAIDGTDTVYAGTSKDGVVYKVASDGAVSVLYDAAEDSISSLALDGHGNLYAGTGSGKGNIYKIPVSGGIVKTVYDKAPKALSMAVDGAGCVYVVSDEQIAKIMPDDSWTTLDNRRAGVQFISLAIDRDGTIFAGAANTAAVYRADVATEGYYESQAHDAGLMAKWGKISALMATPPDTTITIQTRTGNVAEPDETWTQWAYATSGLPVSSPDGRYLQFRLNFTGQGNVSPIVKMIGVACLTRNRAPKVAIAEPIAGQIIAKTFQVKWNCDDPDKDNLNYDLFYSADSGKTWQALGSGLKQEEKKETDSAKKEPEVKEEPKPAAAPQPQGTLPPPPNPAELIAQLKAELEKHPEIPPEVKAKMIAEAPAAIQAAIDKAISEGKMAAPGGASAPQPGPSAPTKGAATKQTTFDWDTTKIPDGRYLIKVVASDKTSNPVGALTDEKVVGPLIVANKPPTLFAFKKDITINPDNSVSVDGYTFDLIPISGVQYKIDDGEWQAAEPKDGIFDSTAEPYMVNTAVLEKGNHTIEIMSINAVGMSTTTKVTAEIK